MALVAVCVMTLGPALCAQPSLSAQPQTMSITLTGQSMIRTDIRAHSSAAVPVIQSLLKGDVIFPNFETTIFDPHKGQKRTDGRFVSQPETMEALKTFGFNLLSLANNHSFDLKTAGVQNVLEQSARLNMAHAGVGKTIDEAMAPGYLETPKGTVALIAMASGLVPDGGNATASRAGVNELLYPAINRATKIRAAFSRASAKPTRKQT